MGSTLALFDLDHRLLDGDSDYGWIEFLVDQNLLPASYSDKNGRFRDEYALGELNFYAFADFSLGVLASMPTEDLKAHRASFMDAVIAPLLLTKGKERIAFHKDQGHTVGIATATNRFVTECIADDLGVDFLLATEAEYKDERYTGKLDGVPCFREGKIYHVERFLREKQLSFDRMAFYSDSKNDIPLLEYVDEAFAVHPDPDLLAHADQKGWQVLSFKEGA